MTQVLFALAVLAGVIVVAERITDSNRAHDAWLDANEPGTDLASPTTSNSHKDDDYDEVELLIADYGEDGENGEGGAAAAGGGDIQELVADPAFAPVLEFLQDASAIDEIKQLMRDRVFDPKNFMDALNATGLSRMII